MYQSLTIVGNLGADPESRYLPSGSPVTNFVVYTNRTYTGSDGQKVKETTKFHVSVFGKPAETCKQYLYKGSTVLVVGRLSPDKESGNPRTFQRPDGTTGATYEMVADSVRFLSKSQVSGDGGGQAQAQPVVEDESLIPF